MQEQKLQIVNKLSREGTIASDFPPVCAGCSARPLGVCGSLTPDQLRTLSLHAIRRRIMTGGEVIAQGEVAENCANIVNGVVILRKSLANGRQQIVGLQFAPDFVGHPFARESALTAEAAVETDICCFPRRLIEQLSSQAPSLEHRLHQQTLKELDEARDWIVTLGRKTALEKVASFLYIIFTRINPQQDATSEFDLPLSRADIADYLGLTIETVSRQFTKLRRDKVIQVSNIRHVCVPDLDRLINAAGIDLDQ